MYEYMSACLRECVRECVCVSVAKLDAKVLLKLKRHEKQELQPTCALMVMYYYLRF